MRRRGSTANGLPARSSRQLRRQGDEAQRQGIRTHRRTLRSTPALGSRRQQQEDDEAGMDQQDGRHRGDARPTERFPFPRCLRHRAPSLSRSRSWERHRDLRWVPRRRSAQNNCPCGDGAHGGTKREVSSCSSRARPKPCLRQATSKRLRSSSANTPWPRMRVRKSLS